MNVPLEENEEILKLNCTSRVQEPYKRALLEDHLFSLVKVLHTSPDHDVILSEMLNVFEVKFYEQLSTKFVCKD